MKIWDGIYYDWDLLEQYSAFHSQLFGIARTLLRLNEESAKPSSCLPFAFLEGDHSSRKETFYTHRHR